MPSYRHLVITTFWCLVNSSIAELDGHRHHIISDFMPTWVIAWG